MADSGSVIAVLVVILAAAAVVFLFLFLMMVPANRAVVVERGGVFHRVLMPGMVFKLPFVDKVRAGVDLRDQSMELSPRRHPGKDGRDMLVQSVVTFHVADPVAYTYGSGNALAAIERAVASIIDSAPPVTGGGDFRGWTDTLNATLVRDLARVTDGSGIAVRQVRSRVASV